MARTLRLIGKAGLLLIGFLSLARAQVAVSQTIGGLGNVASKANGGEGVVLHGHVPAWASADADFGPVDGSEEVRHLTAYLSRSQEHQQAFEHLLRAQQTPNDPLYRDWYSPSELGRQFGASDEQIQAVTAWLEGSGIQVLNVSNSRTFIEFSGSIASLSSAFRVSFHWFRSIGSSRWSITSDPTIPSALAVTIRSISGLSMERAYTTLMHGNADTAYTNCTGNNCAHYITPNDFTAIYDIAPVYAKGIDGSGRTIGIIGEAAIDPADVPSFNSVTGANIPQPTVIVPPNGVDPGSPITVPQNPECTSNSTTLTCELLDVQGEATLDVERAGSVAPGASLQLIVSADTNGDPGTLVATQYVVDSGSTTTPDVVTISYYYCESPSRAMFEDQWNGLFQQAAAQGMSVFVSSGDSDATCSETKFATPIPQDQFVSVNLLCASSSVTCVGGTEFNDTANPSQYWTIANGPGFESALGYIPEGAWNDPVQSSSGTAVYDVEGSGGGFSQYMPAPPWQAATNESIGRALPDVAFSSSCHDGYFTCMESGGNGENCALNPSGIPHARSSCGTSAATPSMAGIMALVDQANNGRQGNANPELYALGANAANLVFHDTTSISSGVTNCDLYVASMCNNTAPSASGVTGGTLGYSLEPGFDEVTGWGSIDVQKLIANWKPAPSLAANPNTISISSSAGAGSTILSLTGFPTSNVTMSCADLPLDSTCDFGGISSENTVTLSIVTNAAYLGDHGHRDRNLPFSLCFIAICFLSRCNRFWKIGRKASFQRSLILVVTLIGLMGFSGCCQSSTVPAGTTTITVTASEGALSASTQIQLVIK
jgi:subtilase family serine protease